MSNEDDTERESTDSAEPAPDDRQNGDSLPTALESSLRTGLQSLSEGLRNVVGDTSGTVSTRGAPRSRPSASRNRENWKQRADDAKRRSKLESDECLIDTRLTDGEFVVIADLLGASINDISVGINPRTNELVVRKNDTVVGRVDLPWDSPEVEGVWFKNGILEVYMRSGDSRSLEESSS